MLLVGLTLLATFAFLGIAGISISSHNRPSVSSGTGVPVAERSAPPTDAAREQSTMAQRSRAAASSVLAGVDARRASAAEKLIANTGNQPAPPKGVNPSTPVGWRLTEAKVIDPGTQTRMPQGTLLRGRTAVARATARVDGKTVTRTFRVALDVFEPSATQTPPGTRPGTWYLNGLWQLSPVGQPAGTRSLSVVRGHISGQYGFNPLDSSGSEMHADVDVLGTPVTGVGAARKGEYVGSKDFDGALVLPEGQDLQGLASQLTGDSR